MRILVVGATGTIGRAVIATLALHDAIGVSHSTQPIGVDIIDGKCAHRHVVGRRAFGIPRNTLSDFQASPCAPLGKKKGQGNGVGVLGGSRARLVLGWCGAGKAEPGGVVVTGPSGFLVSPGHRLVIRRACRLVRRIPACRAPSAARPARNLTIVKPAATGTVQVGERSTTATMFALPSLEDGAIAGSAAMTSSTFTKASTLEPSQPARSASATLLLPQRLDDAAPCFVRLPSPGPAFHPTPLPVAAFSDRSRLLFPPGRPRPRVFPLRAGQAGCGLDNRTGRTRPLKGALSVLSGVAASDDGGGPCTPSSPNDPVFFLNHCNADRLWKAWLTQHGRTHRWWSCLAVVVRFSEEYGQSRRRPNGQLRVACL